MSGVDQPPQVDRGPGTDRDLVYSTYSETRFDLPPTRITVWLSMTIHKLTQQQMTDFIDSFTEVPPKDITGS